MIKLLIVDDELLVITGIKSMLNWSKLGIEICGTATNGSGALAMIEKYQPELVISDIKMPIINGLELAKICNERYGKLPLFILLTSYEEFLFVKEAIKYDVVDYLIKLELDTDMLIASVNKALSILNEHQATLLADGNISSEAIHSFQENFFISLLNNSFENEGQIEYQMKELSLLLTSPYYVSCYCKVLDFENLNMSKEKRINLFESTLQMVREISSRYIPSYVVSLDMKHFSIIFCLEGLANYNSSITEAIKKTSSMVKNYFNVTFFTSIGRPYNCLLSLCESYQEARKISSFLTKEKDIIFYEDFLADSSSKNAFVIHVKKYIKDHIGERLTLNHVAEVFEISPNYLSSLFKKYNDIGFSEYISQMKISKAKSLMDNHNLKIYEIADQLGFDSAFYFSKVFKKVEGCSPSEYLQTKQKIGW